MSTLRDDWGLPLSLGACGSIGQTGAACGDGSLGKWLALDGLAAAGRGGGEDVDLFGEIGRRGRPGCA